MDTIIKLEGDKYTVMHDNGRNLRALRYGAPWRSLVGDGLVLAMAQEIEELRKDREDAIRYRKILAASEREFPLVSVCDDPENDAIHTYGRTRINALIDMMDEVLPITREE